MTGSQLCVGHKSGSEAANQALGDIFDEIPLREFGWWMLMYISRGDLPCH